MQVEINGWILLILGILGNPEMHLDCPVYPELYIRITVRFLDVVYFIFNANCKWFQCARKNIMPP